MRLLLDTQAFLWSVTSSERMSPRARAATASGANDVFVSAASAWELAIKVRLGRIDLGASVEHFVPDQMARNSYLPLPVLFAHATKVSSLPDVHGDPFDRLLIAQAMIEDLALVTADRTLKGYGIKIVW